VDAATLAVRNHRLTTMLGDPRETRRQFQRNVLVAILLIAVVGIAMSLTEVAWVPALACAIVACGPLLV